CEIRDGDVEQVLLGFIKCADVGSPAHLAQDIKTGIWRVIDGTVSQNAGNLLSNCWVLFSSMLPI
ncbi:MAG TPA: hypothetical protein VHT04_16440, partial [Stellaceae bacterium]|nr:hypothetical protein [Stellaceae bacterium]